VENEIEQKQMRVSIGDDAAARLYIGSAQRLDCSLSIAHFKILSSVILISI
jgi:hypothetical protein